MFAVGCSQTETRQYGVELKNNSTKPLTVGLVKIGLPAEKLWESPEDHALSDPKMAEPTWGVVVYPGKTVSVDKVSGEFLPNAGATLRIYVGQLELSQLLAVNRESRNRIEVSLRQGKTTLAAIDHGPFVDVVVVGYQPWGAEADRKDLLREKP